MRSGVAALLGRKCLILRGFALVVIVTGFQIAGVEHSSATHGEAVNLTDSDQSSGDPSITILTDGTIFLAWREVSSLGSSGTIVGESSNGDNLDAIMNASVNQVEARTPDIDSSDTEVFVVWSDAALREVFIANSSDNFATQINISNNSGNSKFPKVAVSSSGEVYVAWVDEGPTSQDVFIANSSDNFATPINISNNDFESTSPDVDVTSSGIVYLIWEETDLGEIIIANSSDNFATPINISNNDGGAVSPRLAVSATDNVFATWIDSNAVTFFLDVFVANSSDNFAKPINISNNDFADSSTPDIATSDSGDLFVVWDEFDYNTGSFELRAAASFSGGDFGSSINVVTSSTFSPTLPRTATTSSGDVYVAWVDQGPTSTDIFLKGNLQFEGASINIDSVSDSSPRWGIDEITVNGTANGFSNDDTIQLDWGDGEPPDEVSISTTDGSWSASYTYDSSAVATNPNQVVASLVGSDDSVKALSDSWQIYVERHTTAVSLNHIPSVPLGTNVTITGLLLDTDAGNSAISDRTITFTGTGASGLGIAISETDGVFSSSGSAPSAPGDLYSVQPIFNGDELYLGSEGVSRGYNVIGSSATEFDLAMGSGTALNLTGFGVTITFDEAMNSGSVYVEPCESPPSPRYTDLEICLSISLGAEISSTNMAHFSISYADAVIPAGFTTNDVSIFHEGLSGIVDLTESRDIATSIATARTADFGKFIVGIALHEGQSPLEVRNELFVGENVISSNPPHITTDKLEYDIDEVASLTIADINANADITEKETISAFVSSTTSGNEGIVVDLVETETDSGVFVGTFTFRAGSSSGSSLQASDGDELSITYDSFLPRFDVTFDDMAEAGVADMSTFRLIGPDSVRAFMGGVNLEFVDAANSPSGNITVTMMYDKELLSGIPHINLKLFHKVNDMEWDDITIDGGNDDELGLIIGKTNSAGIFVIGCSTFGQAGCGGPGGGGGGLPRPGTGVLLDSVAKVVGSENTESSNGSGGGGGGGGSRSTAIATTPSGQAVESSVTTDSGSVVVIFENVEDGSGQLRVSSNGLTAYDEIFHELSYMSQDSEEHGLVHLNGMKYTSVGEVYDIDVSSVIFEGTITVTIPFDEIAVESFGVSESIVRFLHYDKNTASWEDVTAVVDGHANTVTGVMDSLSPVVAAIVIAGNQGEIQISSVRIVGPSISVESGQAMLIATLNNELPVNQDYVILVQLVDDMNVAHHIQWQSSSLVANQDSTPSLSWSGMEAGRYTAQILLLTDLENPNFLAEPVRFAVTV